MIVVDTTVLVPFVLRTGRFQAASIVSNKDPVLVVVDGWRMEFLSALSEYMRSKRASIEDALSRLAAAEFLVRFSHEKFDDATVMTSAAAMNLSACQTLHVLTSQRLGAKLITDRPEILAASPDVAVSLETFGAD